MSEWYITHLVCLVCAFVGLFVWLLDQQSVESSKEGVTFMTSKDLSKVASCPAVISSETTAQTCVSCLVCGEPVPVYGSSYEPRICNECKRAILAMRETMKS